METTMSFPPVVLSTQTFPCEISGHSGSGQDESARSDSGSSNASSGTLTSHFDISTPKSNRSEEVPPLVSARRLWTPPVPRLALKKPSGQNAVRGLLGSQTSRTHTETSKGMQPAGSNWRTTEAEKSVGAVVVPDARTGNGSRLSSSSNGPRRLHNRCGQLFEELMSLRSENEQLSRQNVFLTRDLDEHVTEGERLKTLLRRRSSEVEDLSRQQGTANGQATQELLEARVALVDYVAKKEHETQDLTEQLRLMTDKNEASRRELFESRITLVEYVNSVSSTETSLKEEVETLRRQNHVLLHEVARLRETSCNTDRESISGQREASCKNKPTLLGRVAIPSASSIKKTSSEYAWLRQSSFMSEETATPLPEDVSGSSDLKDR